MSEGESRRIVIAGGGVAGLEAALALRALCGRSVRIDLVAPERGYTYRPLAVAQPFGLAEEFRVDLGEFERSQDVRVRVGHVDRVDAGSVHTTDGTSYEYDDVIVATGAMRSPLLEGALSFDGREGVSAFEELLGRIEGGEAESIAFCAGARIGWFLPMYELALMTAAFASERDMNPRITIVTPESAPLVAFGPDNSAEVARLLDEEAIETIAGTYPSRLADGRLELVPEGSIPVDEVVAMPRLEGPAIEGLPKDEAGFIPVDERCRVEGREREYAAGDATSFPVKQGGLAAQMAAAAARAIAADLGKLGDAEPFRPTLDGTLLTGRGAHHLRQSLVLGTGDPEAHRAQDEWLPLAKVTAPFLTDYLAEHAGFPGGRAGLA